MRPAKDSRDARELFLAELPTLERIVAAVCRRNRLEGAEAEDFASSVRLKLIDDDYAAVRRFQARSSFATWLMVVVQRHLLDYRTRLWGKWRPSAEAERLGEHAVVLERLVRRDSLPFDEACRLLRRETGTTLSDPELESILNRLPDRTPRPRVEPIDTRSPHPDRDPSPEDVLIAADAERVGAEAARILNVRLRQLAPDDRLIVRLRFRDGMSIAQIARSTGSDQRHLYYRVERIAETLREALARAGVDRATARELLARGPSSLELDFSESSPAHPSIHDESAEPGGAEARE